MSKNILIVVVFILFFSLYFFLNINKNSIEGKYPIPTEIIQKKKDKKKFKKGRKEYYKQIHKTAPDVDWEKMEIT